jgi:hypothetical protein
MLILVLSLAGTSPMILSAGIEGGGTSPSPPQPPAGYNSWDYAAISQGSQTDWLYQVSTTGYLQFYAKPAYGLLQFHCYYEFTITQETTVRIKIWHAFNIHSYVPQGGAVNSYSMVVNLLDSQSDPMAYPITWTRSVQSSPWSSNSANWVGQQEQTMSTVGNEWITLSPGDYRIDFYLNCQNNDDDSMTYHTTEYYWYAFVYAKWKIEFQ